MKTIKLKKISPKIDRKIISKIGEKIYHADGIKSINIEVSFKDGSFIAYRRSETRDHIDRFVEKAEDEDIENDD